MLPNHQSITHLALIQLSQQEQIIFKANNKHTEKYSNLSSRYFTLQVNNENKRLKVQSFKLEKHIKFGISKIINIGPFIWYARKIFRKTNIFYIISYIKQTFFVCVSRGKKCQFSENFCKCTGWMIPRGGEGGVLPCFFLKIRKKCTEFLKNALIVSIPELNFPLKDLFS